MATAYQLHGDDDLGKAAAAAGQPRRKGIGTRIWQVISESGQSHTEEFGKQSIMRRTGLPARDLRILDPILSYPSTVLGRERAIVVNLEHIKAIITATEVLMVYSTNPLGVQFVQDLRDRLASPTDTPIQQDGEFPSKRTITDEDADESRWGYNDLNTGNENTTRQSTEASSKFPFEFRALEACLESACRCLESETQTLEQEAYPALDELTSKISTLNLERVRQIKSRLVAISGRVQKVRDELEHLLDDDNDMAEMYLTEKLASSSVDQTSVREDLGDEALADDGERSEESNSQRSSEIYTGMKVNVEELEMLLEAYFAQIDGISQKLFHMNEYVDDTEDFINIMLDDKQNQLLQMGVMLSTGNLILNAGIVVVGLFGMNISIELFSGKPVQFWETALGTTGGCIALYLIAIGWGRRKNLI